MSLTMVGWRSKTTLHIQPI